MSGPWREHSINHAGLQMAVRESAGDGAVPVLALHGWRDNAASFEPLAPHLPGLRLYALDLPGHGLSAWRGAGADYCTWRYVDDVLAAAAALGLGRFSLLGHSMGGAVACLFAALYPERCERLILLDSPGPMATAPAEAPAQMRSSLDQQSSLQATFKQRYASFESAVQARAEKGLGLEAATVLGLRGIASDQNGCYWTTDPRLALPNPLSLTEEQVAAFMQAIVCPVLLVAAPGYWQQRRAWFEQRCGYIKGLLRHDLPGHHHQHLEGQVEEVAGLIRAFVAESVR